MRPDLDTTFESEFQGKGLHLSAGDKGVYAALCAQAKFGRFAWRFRAAVAERRRVVCSQQAHRHRVGNSSCWSCTLSCRCVRVRWLSWKVMASGSGRWSRSLLPSMPTTMVPSAR